MGRNWIRKHGLIIKATLFALLPLAACLVTCARQGYSIREVYLPASPWNDELFYFKQVEGIVKFGYPYGYFGFNESHAQFLSFAAWSPVLVLPWVLFGKLLGWGLLSPVIYNILFLSLALFFFVILAKPGYQQVGILTFLFLLFTRFPRYMLSGMPEVLCFSLLILFFGLELRYLEERKKWNLVLLFAVSFLLTLMRPYFLVFLLLPCYFLSRSVWLRVPADPKEPVRNRAGAFRPAGLRKWAGLLAGAAILGAAGAGYGAVKHFLGAEYFTPLFDTTWISAFLRQGFGEGIRYMASRLFHGGAQFLKITVEGLQSGAPTGAYFAGFLAVLALLLGYTAAEIRRKQKKEALVYGHLAFCFVGMLAALLLMYKMEEGSKHLQTFIVVGIFAVSGMETRFYKKAVFLGVLFAYLYTFKAVSAYEYQVPFVSLRQEEILAYWEGAFAEHMTLEREDAPSFSNTVIWTFADTIGTETTGTRQAMDWQILYALPEGFGISCCTDFYLLQQFDGLKSRYLAAPAGGTVDAMCTGAGFTEVGRLGTVVVYKRY
ncbi:MAG: hypothetical protein LBQ15_03290 [Clostridium sp.]|jgi:hypothetical protein|nr:hypothetical protein [Clostridium sp.]